MGHTALMYATRKTVFFVHIIHWSSEHEENERDVVTAVGALCISWLHSRTTDLEV